MIWVTSDTHFCHENIIRYEMRPFESVYEMNERLIENWNANVKVDDVVFHVGDFGLGREEHILPIIKRLNGKITLIRGNHDDSLSKLLSLGFASVCDLLALRYKHWELRFSHVPLEDLIYEDTSHGILNIHGHIHGKTRVSKNRINVSCDAWEYTPVTLEEILIEYRKSRRLK